MLKIPFLIIIVFEFMSCSLTKSSSKHEVFLDPQTGYFGVKKSGRIVIPARYQKIWPAPEDGAPFSSNVNLTSMHSEHLLSVFHNGRWERIDKKGVNRFYAMPFDNGPDYYVQGLSRFVTVNHKVGFHDRMGNIVIKAKYDFATPFKKVKEGKKITYAQVCIGCYIKRSPQKLYPVSTYADGRDRLINFYPVCEHSLIEGGKWGYINIKGEELIPLNFPTSELAYKELLKVMSFITN